MRQAITDKTAEQITRWWRGAALRLAGIHPRARPGPITTWRMASLQQLPPSTWRDAMERVTHLSINRDH